MTFISLTTGKLHTKDEKKIKTFLAGYVGRFYRDLENNDNSAVDSDFHGTITNNTDIPSEDVQKYLSIPSNFAKGMQDDINLYVTRDRLNNAGFRQKLQSIT